MWTVHGITLSSCSVVRLKQTFRLQIKRIQPTNKAIKQMYTRTNVDIFNWNDCLIKWTAYAYQIWHALHIG